jgi:hypothetical protein
MEKINETQGSILNVLQHYLDAFEKYDKNAFYLKHAPEIWSLAQMYDHICKSTSHFFLANTVRCIEERKGQIGGESNDSGKNVMTYNSFPPKKFKQPGGNDINTEVEKDPLFYKSYLLSLKADVGSVFNQLPSKPSNYKCYHPAFEWLNSHEWLQMLDIHLRHHLRQQEELEGYLNIS